MLGHPPLGGKSTLGAFLEKQQLCDNAESTERSHPPEPGNDCTTLRLHVSLIPLSFMLVLVRFPDWMHAACCPWPGFPSLIVQFLSNFGEQIHSAQSFVLIPHDLCLSETSTPPFPTGQSAATHPRLAKSCPASCVVKLTVRSGNCGKAGFTISLEIWYIQFRQGSRSCTVNPKTSANAGIRNIWKRG